ncbi:MAG: efflux RND transporter permease subunit [Candidatus Riflebacteria bacterium]|nr:efflux RND transporter permease subunit [Candidatus Riflebacteria bacterium]
MSIPRFSITHPISVTMLMCGMALIGVGALFLLNVALFPNVDIPVAFIRAPYEGVDPAEIETIVTRKIEDQINTVENIKKITSYSSEGAAIIVIEFNYGTNIDLAAVDVRAKVDLAKRVLPDEMNDITTSKVDFNAMSIMNLAVGGNFDDVELRRIADREIKPAFQQISGVASVDISGGREREIRVKVFPEKLLALNLTIDDIAAAIAKDNANTSLGNMTEGAFRYLLRSDGRMTNPQHLGNIIVKEVNSRPIYISELAVIEDSYKDISTVSRINGSPSVTMAIKKVTEANPVNISDAAMKLIPELEKKYQGKLKIVVGKDQTTFIRDTIQMVKDNSIMGGLFAVIILFIFLQNYRSTLIVGISIPIAILATFGLLMLKKDISLNLMTLGGLALGIGMIVDNAIVVMENIYRFYSENKGGDRRELAIKATEEVFMPVIASTATTVVAFLPIGLIPEMVGEIFFNMSLSIIFSLSASLVVAVTFLPMLCSKFLSLEGVNLETIVFRMYKSLLNWAKANIIKCIASVIFIVIVPTAGFFFGIQNAAIKDFMTKLSWVSLSGNPGKESLLFGLGILAIVLLLPVIVAFISFIFNLLAFKILFPIFNGILEAIRKVYLKALRVLVTKWQARLAYLLLIVSLFALSVKNQPPFSFFPAMDRGELVVEFETPAGTSVDNTDIITKQIEQLFLGVPEVDKVITKSEVGKGSLDIKMVPTLQRIRTTDEVVREIRKSVEIIPGIKTLNFKEPRMGRPNSGKSIQIEVLGDDFAILETICLQIYERIKGVEGLIDLESGVENGRPEFRLIFDREKIRDMGLNLVTIADRARTYIYGTIAGKYRESNDEYDIRVEAVDISKDKIARIKDLEIALPDGKFVKLSQIAKFEAANGYTTIERKNVARCLIVQGEPDKRSIGAITSDIQERIKDIEIPPGYRINFGGENEDMARSFKYLAVALVASLLLVYMIMASQFESLLYPFLIMFTIPLSYIGVIAGFNYMGFSFTVTAMIGIIMLAGIAVNNGIVLIEFILQRRATLDESNAEAAIAAGNLRFRPILMTTSTTLLGMLPLAFGIGAGADFYQPLAISVSGGLVVSTLLTLTFVPSIFVTAENVISFISKFFGQFTHKGTN